jgi:hypothetical protein
MLYARIETGRVSQIVESPAPPAIPGQWVRCEATVYVGDSYTGSEFQRPAVSESEP